MSKLPFLVRKSFNIVDRVEGKELFVQMTPKNNICFLLFVFVESLKMIANMQYMELKEEEQKQKIEQLKQKRKNNERQIEELLRKREALCHEIYDLERGM